jgi:hypothetical protein
MRKKFAHGWGIFFDDIVIHHGQFFYRQLGLRLFIPFGDSSVGRICPLPVV